MGVRNYRVHGGRVRGESSGGVSTTYLTDALGSVTATVDRAGSVINTYRHKPYGGLLAKTGTGTDPRYPWTGDTGSRTTRWQNTLRRSTIGSLPFGFRWANSSREIRVIKTRWVHLKIDVSFAEKLGDESQSQRNHRIAKGGRGKLAFLKPGPNSNGLRGRMGGQVYSGGGEDTIVRDYVKPVQPDTPAQQAQKGRFTRGAQGWGTLDDSQRAAWAEKAKAFGVRAKGSRRQTPKPLTGAQYYTSLCAKFLACTPGGTMPQNPPTTKFAGDSIALTLTATTGNLSITASGSSQAGVKTEIMVQPLAASYRKPSPGCCRTKAYATFASGSLTKNIPVAPGAYAVAVQFVNMYTGETAGYQALGSTSVALSVEDGGIVGAPIRSKRAA